jgi:hypothetical protein
MKPIGTTRVFNDTPNQKPKEYDYYNGKYYIGKAYHNTDRSTHTYNRQQTNYPSLHGYSLSLQTRSIARSYYISYCFDLI